MISALAALIVGWLLAAKVKSMWLGIAGCFAAGIVIGTVAVLVAVHSIETLLPFDHSRIPDAIFESSVRFSFIALVFYAIPRVVMRVKNRPLAVGKSVSGDTRKCPYCAELVKTEAVVCKHCGRDIAGGIADQQQRAAFAEKEAQTAAHGNPERAKHEHLLQLCADIQHKDLDVHSYAAMAAQVGGSFTWSGSMFDGYSYTRGGSSTTFKEFGEIRPWFLKNVVPSIEKAF